GETPAELAGGGLRAIRSRSTSGRPRHPASKPASGARTHGHASARPRAAPMRSPTKSKYGHRLRQQISAAEVNRSEHNSGGDVGLEGVEERSPGWWKMRRPGWPLRPAVPRVSAQTVQDAAGEGEGVAALLA